MTRYNLRQSFFFLLYASAAPRLRGRPKDAEPPDEGRAEFLVLLLGVRDVVEFGLYVGKMATVQLLEGLRETVCLPSRPSSFHRTTLHTSVACA